MDPDGFVRALARICDEEKVELLLPISEAGLLAVSGRREQLSGILIPFPDHATVSRVCDKAAVMACAERIGIAVPRQVSAHTIAQLRSVDAGTLHFPLVLKPARSVVEKARAKTTVVHVSDPQSWDAAVDTLSPEHFPVLVQQRIEGPGIGVFLLLWQGRLVAHFGHQRIREKPPSGGVSVLRESVAVDPLLLRLSQTLLASFGWNGVAMVEYKRDARTGIVYIMEINGRFWGSLQLAIDAGVDFPRLLADLALGQFMPASESYKLGVASRWFWGDVDHLLARIRHSNRELGLEEGAGGRLAAMRDFLLGSKSSVKNEVFWISDPKPALRESAAWFASLRVR